MENHLQSITAELLALHRKYACIDDNFKKLDKMFSSIEDRMSELETQASELPAGRN
ncbi:hypothetical protein SAMN02799630_02527 [Paenibacillus sp. UNCCL117]|uniref:hypothetical protein n=1 Tax=unclassified Paenibacillus TaxID=185978 RepID=UPI00087E720C|nr:MULTISPECIES: hypothetical protein [unclassified Paenibacillus]SDC04670.1 hypothetical protein SAMN04488602_101196 [Paenibacillus sp. cl123]SFW37380.1 hypothetical protein SAMN02799630_02527 [Paenibacillus sp. UNCCL117]